MYLRSVLLCALLLACVLTQSEARPSGYMARSGGYGGDRTRPGRGGRPEDARSEGGRPQADRYGSRAENTRPEGASSDFGSRAIIRSGLGLFPEIPE